MRKLANTVEMVYLDTEMMKLRVSRVGGEGRGEQVYVASEVWLV